MHKRGSCEGLRKNGLFYIRPCRFCQWRQRVFVWWYYHRPKCKVEGYSNDYGPYACLRTRWHRGGCTLV